MLANIQWIQTIIGSPVALAILLMSIVTLGIAIERAWYFWKRSASPDAALARILVKVRSGDMREALWACGAMSHPAGTAVRQMLEAGSDEEMEERLLIALSEQRLLLERNVSTLGTLAAIAPLTGLLGTVWGIMRAFHDMSLAGSAAPSVVAGGVSEALITTALGLVVAIPSAILYNHFTRRIQTVLVVAENSARSIRAAVHRASANPNPAPRGAETDLSWGTSGRGTGIA